MLLLLALLACGDKDAADPETTDADGDGVVAADDCDDTDAAVYPGADELCNGADDDCDGDIDEDAIDGTVWHEDADLDGYGDPLITKVACEAGTGWVSDTTDCDDEDATVNPGADELCDDLDNDCDDDVDEEPVDAPTWYRDLDEDGYGDADTTLAACDQPSGYVEDATDCDDEDSDLSPGADELCDDRDNDCDEEIDEDPVDGFTWYVDGDGDGYGDDSAPIYSCVEEPGTIPDGGDCDDTEARIYPGAEEVCGDGLVNACEATVDDAAAVCGGWGSAVDVFADDAFLDAWYAIEDAYMGATLAGGFDLDGNGLDDVAAGLFHATGAGGEERAGAVYLVQRVGPGGVMASLGSLPGTEAGMELGSEVAGAGDLDGDGHDELLVAATMDGDRGQGRVYLVPGQSGPVYTLDDAQVSWEGVDDGEIAGTEALAVLGDIDTDGLPDFLVGARYGSLGATYAGQAYVVSGADTGSRSLADATARLYSTSSYGYAATRVAGPGDLDGDGVPDAVVDATGDAAAWIAFGPFSGDVDLSADADLRLLDGSELTLTYVTGDDLDGDGTADLVLSSTVESTYAERAGGVFVHYGPWTEDVELAGGALSILGETEDGYLGGELALVPDLDGDGEIDLLVGSGSSLIRQGSISVLGGTGQAFLFLGLAGRSGVLTQGDADVRFSNSSSGDSFGCDLASAGDIDGDGLSDLAISGPEAALSTGLGDVWTIPAAVAY